jgi:hypothetical protein
MLPIAALCMGLTSLPLAQDRPTLQGAHLAVTASTQPISGVALVSWVSKPGSPAELDLAVVWRGRPGWFLENKDHYGASGGGNDASFGQTIKYGGVHLDYRFVRKPRTLEILDRSPLDLNDANVVLVDQVDTPEKANVVAKIAIPSTLASPGALVQPFGRSPEILAFLRCDVEVPQVGARPWIEKLCRDLSAASRSKDPETGAIRN